MSLINGVLAFGRARTETRFTETVAVATYEEHTDRTTLTPTRTLVATHYTGPAQVKTGGTGAAATQSVEVASRLLSEQNPMLKVPAGSPLIPVGAIVTVTASTSDSTLTSREFRIAGEPHGGQVTAHRYPLSEVS